MPRYRPRASASARGAGPASTSTSTQHLMPQGACQQSTENSVLSAKAQHTRIMPNEGEQRRQGQPSELEAPPPAGHKGARQ
eukprot:scaffold230746_cov26-Tisochrysis_lutea.AAC.1